jgi:hypothetical protein
MRRRNNMILKDIVCDYEYASRLKELGVKQESLYYMTEMIDGLDINDFKRDDGKDVSAFTSEELQEILWPKTTLSIFLGQNGYEVYEEDREIIIVEDKLSNALAKMLIYLIEKGYYKIGD